MKLKRLICALSAAALLLCGFSVTAAAEDSQTIDMNEFGFGFTVEIPASYNLYSASGDSTLYDMGFFFDSSDTPEASIPGYSLNSGWEKTEFHLSDITKAKSETLGEFVAYIVSSSQLNYGMAVESVDAETLEVNGNEYLHCTFTGKGGGMTAFFDNYYINIENDIVRLSAIAFTLDGDSAYAKTAAELSLSLVESANITGKVGASETVSDAAPAPQTTAPAKNESKSLLATVLSFEFPLWIFLVLLALLLVVGAKFSKPREWQDEPFSLENSKSIQGFCAVAIIMHHLSQNIAFAGKPVGALRMLVDAGVLFVGVFFFFSGYGLLKSLRSKENYLGGFFKKRLPSILVPFYSCILVFVLTAALLGEKFKASTLFGYLSGWLLINSHMWYIVEIAILYIAFFLIFKFIKNEKVAFGVMGGFVCLLVVASLLLGHGQYWLQGEWWFNSTLLFFVGMVISRFEAPLLKFAKRFYLLLLPVFIAAFGVLFSLNLKLLDSYSYYRNTGASFLCLSVQLPTIILFVLILLLVMMKVKFQNPVLKFLGRVALELYLIHNLCMQYLRSPLVMNVKSESMYILLVLAFAILLAALLSRFDRYVVGLFTGKIHPSISAEGDKKIHSIDFFRLIAVFFVVAIHIPFENAAAAGVTIAFGKVAVPFFIVVCGYFLYRDDGKEFMARLKKQALRIFILTVAANVFYMLWQMVPSLISGTPLNILLKSYFTKDAVINLLLWNMSPFGDHLWYLASLLYALLITMLLSKLKAFKYAMFLAPLLLSGYIALSFFGNPADYYVYRNAVLCTLAYLMFGCLISRYKALLMKPSVWWYVGAGALLCALNVIEFNARHGDLSTPYFSAELLVYVLVLICLKLPSLASGTLAERLGSRCTLFIYIVHIALADVLLSLPAANVPAFFRTLAPVAVFIATLLLAVVWDFFKTLVLKGTKKLPAAKSE